MIELPDEIIARVYQSFTEHIVCENAVYLVMKGVRYYSIILDKQYHRWRVGTKWEMDTSHRPIDVNYLVEYLNGQFL